MAGNLRLQRTHRNAYRKFSGDNAWSPELIGRCLKVLGELGDIADIAIDGVG
jgi:hypothetical protein